MRQICQRGLFFSRAIPYCLLKRIAHLNAPNFAILSKQLSFFFSLMLHASQKLASVLCPSITSFFFPFIYGLPLCCGQSFLLSLSLYCRLLRICFLLRQAMKNLARMTMVALVASSCFLFSSFLALFLSVHNFVKSDYARISPYYLFITTSGAKQCSSS